MPEVGSNCYFAKDEENTKNDVTTFSLKTSRMKILNSTGCKALFGGINEVHHYFTKHLDVIPWDICTQNPPDDICEDDLGKPLICNENGKAVVYGIHSKTLDDDYGNSRFDNMKCDGETALFTNVFLNLVFINCILEIRNQTICQARQDESENVCSNDNIESKAPVNLSFECSKPTTIHLSIALRI